LEGFDQEQIRISDQGQERSLERKEIALIRLTIDF